MINEFYDLDKQENIRCYSESSNASTSGYSTMSPGPGSNQTQMIGNNSPSPQFSNSPAQSPATYLLQTEFSNLNLPHSSPSIMQQKNSPHYSQLTAPMAAISSVTQNNNMFVGAAGQQQFYNGTQYAVNTQCISGDGSNSLQQQQQSIFSTNTMNIAQMKGTGMNEQYSAMLEILEQPVDKFRFRYKSEMHGTHGSLNGANSKRTPKTFPEVRLVNYTGPAIIRCSLYQTNLESPHSHQLVVRKDDHDVCDPHDLHVSLDRGYVAQFKNMGIIHTAKKFIQQELLKKKEDRLVFRMGRRELSTKQIQELYKETEKEAKDMNLNQVRLCFEAFKIDDSNIYTPIAAPVYTNPINNRKSAQTGELRIVRLSIASGSVLGNDELILLVEKVSKKNIKVRFFEKNDDDETVWEEFAKFRESDVHHQYAIVCQTPPFKDKNIETQKEVFIELIRPSDDERSFPALPFRYKPRDAIVSRKRRRTCSTATSSSGTGSATSSLEIPKAVEEQAAQLAVGKIAKGTISEEFDKEYQLKQLDPQYFQNIFQDNSKELINLFPMLDPNDSFENAFGLRTDGASSTSLSLDVKQKKLMKLVEGSASTSTSSNFTNAYLQHIFKINDELRVGKAIPEQRLVAECAKQIKDLFLEHADGNCNGDTLVHEVISQKPDNIKLAIKTFEMLSFFKLQELVNQPLNKDNESGLHCACLLDRSHYIRPLLSLQCNPNIQDLHNNTALHVAVKEEHTKCIEVFLNSNTKADLSLKNDQGLSPLHMALRQNNFDLAKILVKHDREAINVTNKDGDNALHLAVLQQNIELVVLILDAKNVEDILIARNTANCTALELAKRLGTKSSNSIVQILEPLYKHLPHDMITTIKEEIENSSTDDDEESNEAMDIDTKSNAGEYCSEIKEEDNSFEVDDYHPTIAVLNLEDLLKDAKRFNALVELLDQKYRGGDKPKWKHLAEKLKMHHLVVLWKNADAMLNYVKTKCNIEWRIFAKALAEVDSGAMLLFPQR